MNAPRMTARRWFWGVLAASLVWCLAGRQWDGDKSNPRTMRYVQNNLVAQVPMVMLVPAEFVFTSLEGAASSAIQRVTQPRQEGATVEVLQEQVRNLQAQNIQLTGLLEDLRARAVGWNMLPAAGLTPRDVVEAHVLGPQAGAGTSMLHLDKGNADGIKPGMAVVAPLEQVTVLGRVIGVGQKDCQVLLLSDPQMRTRADIVRDPTTRISSACMVEGLGSNGMSIRTVDVPLLGTGAVPPERGDFVRLVDGAWPANVQFMAIGQIDEVRTREDQGLRYELKVVPLRPLNNLRSVMIVVKE